MTSREGNSPAQPDYAEQARRIMRSAEMSAGIMRDRRRTGGWAGAENTARAFDRIAENAQALWIALSQKDPTHD